jgi:hypothetical protein
VISLGNCNMKLSTEKVCFIHDFISTLDNVTEFFFLKKETMVWYSTESARTD